MNITKEGTEVKVGQVWRDLDVRMDGRHCRVMQVANGKALMSRCNPSGALTSSRTTSVSISRMHTSSQGWALVKDVPTKPE